MRSLLVLACALGSGTAMALQVRGKVEVPTGGTTLPEEPLNKRTYYWQQWNGFLPAVLPRFDAARELAVVLTGRAPRPPESSFQLHGGTLTPSTIVAAGGTQLRIENRDDFVHELFADGLPGFEALSTAPGNARPVSLPNAGKWIIRDRLYAHVTGYLHAISGLVARADVRADGAFEFSDVAPGDYTLKVFHRDRELSAKPVQIPANRPNFAIDPFRVNLSSGG